MKEKDLFIGYQEQEGGQITALIAYQDMTENSLPWIKNTSSGTLFPNLSGGGITVKNGLIKTWNMAGTFSGGFQAGDVWIAVSQGLITDVQ